MTEAELLAENAKLRSIAISALQMCKAFLSAMPSSPDLKATALAVADHAVAQLERKDPSRMIQ